MDDLRWDYYAELGYDHEHANRLHAEGGFRAKYDYWKPFEAHAVERLLSDYSRCVFDFGAGHSVFEDPALFARVKRLLADFKYVILLLPSPDPSESQQILAQRWADERHAFELIDMNRHFLCHPSNRELATHVVYTEGKTPQETCEEIMAIVTRDNVSG
jgi:hypothetical protein